MPLMQFLSCSRRAARPRSALHGAVVWFVAVLIVTMPGCSAGQQGERVVGPEPIVTDAPAVERATPPFGFNFFPYAATLDAIDKTHELIHDYGNVFVVQRDNGIPWYEALNDLPYPSKVRETWADFAARRPADVPVYVALAPLGDDRKTLIYASEGSAQPDVFSGRALNDPEVIRAYTNYVLKAVDTFRPDYLNVGLEAGDVALRAPQEWPKFVQLYRHVAEAVRTAHPEVRVGISFILQSLLDPVVAERSLDVINHSDFVGISFYPYMSPFYERFGAPALDAPPAQWRAPLDYLRTFTTKPIAICETGYNSRPVELSNFNLSLDGTQQLQEQYLRELADYARQENYLFVVWFTVVDYERLFETLSPGNGAYKLWQYVGLLDPNLNRKPAWSAWLEIVGKQDGTKPEAVEPVLITFEQDVNRFQGSEHDHVRTAPARTSRALPTEVTRLLEWSFDYRRGRWQYVARPFDRGRLRGRDTMVILARSTRPGPILIQLEEHGGEAFYYPLQPSTEWTEYELPFSEFAVSAETRQDGLLSVESIVKLLIADAGAVTEGASGDRAIEIGRIEFR